MINALCGKAAGYAPEYDEIKIREDWRAGKLYQSRYAAERYLGYTLCNTEIHAGGKIREGKIIRPVGKPAGGDSAALSQGA